MKPRLVSALLGAVAAGSMIAGTLVPLAPAAAIPVFDSTNYAQNLLQAARALNQINNQIKSLLNEAAMLEKMAKNLQTIDFPELARITETLLKIDRLMGEARGVKFKVDEIEEKFRALFPDSFGEAMKTDRAVREAKARLDTVMGAFLHTMSIQAQVVENVEADARLLAELVAKSQGAEGSLQAQQATNQLLALTAKQQFQIENMMAAQFRSESMERARRVQAETDARAATKRFLGTGKAYTPE